MMPQAAWLRKVKEEMNTMQDNDGNGNGEEPPYEEGMKNPSDLPAPSSYPVMRPPQSEKMVDTLVGVEGLEDDQKDQLWLAESKLTRHFQLTNLTGEDIIWLRRYLNDIQIVNAWDMPRYTHQLQTRVLLDILARKSRSDLKDGLRERPMWGVMNILKYVMEQSGVKAPRDSAGWFGMFGNKGRKGYG